MKRVKSKKRNWFSSVEICKQACKSRIKVGQSEYEIKNSDASITLESSSDTAEEAGNHRACNVSESCSERFQGRPLFLNSTEESGQSEQMAGTLSAYSPALLWPNTTRHGRYEAQMWRLWECVGVMWPGTWKYHSALFQLVNMRWKYCSPQLLPGDNLKPSPGK